LRDRCSSNNLDEETREVQREVASTLIEASEVHDWHEKLVQRNEFKRLIVDREIAAFLLKMCASAYKILDWKKSRRLLAAVANTQQAVSAVSQQQPTTSQTSTTSAAVDQQQPALTTAEVASLVTQVNEMIQSFLASVEEKPAAAKLPEYVEQITEGFFQKVSEFKERLVKKDFDDLYGVISALVNKQRQHAGDEE